MRPPTQSRSRESTENLLEIGRRLIEERGIDECNMNDVAAAAGSSIGALYFRFGNKDKFIREVMQRQVAASSEQLARAAAEIQTTAVSPADVIAGVIRFALLQYRENRGLLRASLSRSLGTPGEWEPIQTLGENVVNTAIRLLSPFPELHQDATWQRHVRIAMQMIFGTLNNILLGRPGPLQLSDPGMTGNELTEAATRYLRWERVQDQRRSIAKRKSTAASASPKR